MQGIKHLNPPNLASRVWRHTYCRNDNAKCDPWGFELLALVCARLMGMKMKRSLIVPSPQPHIDAESYRKLMASVRCCLRWRSHV